MSNWYQYARSLSLSHPNALAAYVFHQRIASLMPAGCSANILQGVDGEAKP